LDGEKLLRVLGFAKEKGKRFVIHGRVEDESAPGQHGMILSRRYIEDSDPRVSMDFEDLCKLTREQLIATNFGDVSQRKKIKVDNE
jgi:hypothetical protein